MSPSEFARLCARVTGWWPRAPWPKETAALYFDDLRDFDAEVVFTALTSLYREGSPFPPTGAQIRKHAVALDADIPGFGEVWDHLHKAARLFGQARSDEAVAWLTDWHPLAGELARILTFRDFCLTTQQEVFHGQARRTWEQLARRAERDSTLAGLPSAGLRAVERANGPRRLGDVLRALPEPEEAA